MHWKSHIVSLKLMKLVNLLYCPFTVQIPYFLEYSQGLEINQVSNYPLVNLSHYSSNMFWNYMW